MFAVSSIAETGKYVFFGKVREIVKNLLLCHADSQIREHIVDGDSHAPDAGLSAALVRLNCDPVFVIHIGILPQPIIVEHYNAPVQRSRERH